MKCGGFSVIGIASISGGCFFVPKGRKRDGVSPWLEGSLSDYCSIG